MQFEDQCESIFCLTITVVIIFINGLFRMFAIFQNSHNFTFRAFRAEKIEIIRFPCCTL